MRADSNIAFIMENNDICIENTYTSLYNEDKGGSDDG